jgi:hypothetical protein
LLDLLNPEGQGTTILGNGGNYSPGDTASYPRRLESTLNCVDSVWGLLQHEEVGCVASVLEEFAAVIFRVIVFRICGKY